jgi:hypothetical protein
MSKANTFLQQLQTMFTKHEATMFEYHRKFFEDYNRLVNDIQGQRTAKKLIKLEEAKEYPKDSFFTIQCVKSNTEECTIMTDQGEVTFPPSAFFMAAMYPINVLMLKKAGGAEFIGYIN